MTEQRLIEALDRLERAALQQRAWVRARLLELAPEPAQAVQKNPANLRLVERVNP